VSKAERANISADIFRLSNLLQLQQVRIMR